MQRRHRTHFALVVLAIPVTLILFRQSTKVAAL